MGDSPQTRDLTDLEKSGYNLVRMYEDAIREKALTITLTASARVAEIIAKGHASRYTVIKTEYKPKTQNYHVTFSLIEFRKYIAYILPLCGLVLNIDGTMTTSDRRIISNQYLGDESK